MAGSPLPTRKWAAALLAGALFIATLAACSNSGTTGTSAAPACAPATGKVTLSFWSWVPGMQQVVDLWNGSHPNIQVKLTETPTGSTGGTYQKMFDALKAHTQSDLGQVEFDTLPSFRIQGGLANIAACGGISPASAKFPAWTWNQVTFGEQHAVYAVPQDTGPMGLLYRKDLFARYGVTPPTTWAEFAQDAAKVHAADPNVYLTNFNNGAAWLAGMAWQQGAHWFTVAGNGWQVNIDSAQTKAVAQYWQGLLDAGTVSTLSSFTTGWNKALDNGQILAWPTAAWGTTLLKQYAPDTSGDWAVAPLPQWTAGGTSVGNWGGSTTAVFTGSAHPYEAAQFALWLNTDPQAAALLISKGGLYPAAVANQSATALTEKDSFYGGQQIFDVFAAAEKQVNPDFTWGPVMTDTYNALSDAMNAAASKQGTLAGGLTTTQGKTVTAMRQQGITVSG